MFNLICKKFPEIFHIHFTFHGVHYCHGTVKLHLFFGHYILYRFHDIGKFPDP